MPQNGLKLNDGKTEFLSLHSWHHPPLSVPPICIGNDQITPSTSAQNLGVMFNDMHSLWPHISVVTAAFCRLCHISHIQNVLTLSACKSLDHSLITSHLDYCNSSRAGLPNINIQKLQCIQNAAAHLTMRSKKYDNITPVLKELH